MSIVVTRPERVQGQQKRRHIPTYSEETALLHNSWLTTTAFKGSIAGQSVGDNSHASLSLIRKHSLISIIPPFRALYPTGK
jgi:hypothetical protein